MTHGVSQGSARRNWWRIAGWGTAVALILFPLVVMLVTGESGWSAADFIFAIVVLGSIGIGLELAARKNNRAFTAAVGIALLLCVMQIVFTGAVGIIGNESEDSNLLFVGVVGIALAGSAIALLRPARMAVTMVVAAIAQAAVPLVASLVSDSPMESIWAREVIVLTVAFTAMWLVAARLFRTAAKQG